MIFYFSKMHSLGNDFMVVDAVTQKVFFTPERIRALADRRIGVGFDRLLVIEPPYDPDVDFHYRVFDSKANELLLSGSAARCLLRFVISKGLVNKKVVVATTSGGSVSLSLTNDEQVSVDFGKPCFLPEKIPFKAVKQEKTYILQNKDCTILCGCVLIGKSFCIVEIQDFNSCDIKKIATIIKNHERFIEPINIGFMTIVNEHEINLKILDSSFEENLSSTTGASAAVAIGIYQGKIKSPVKVNFDNGFIMVEKEGAESTINAIGPANHIFDGEICI